MLQKIVVSAVPIDKPNADSELVELWLPAETIRKIKTSSWCEAISLMENATELEGKMVVKL